jgi:CheY-like chemotaxis protein
MPSDWSSDEPLETLLSGLDILAVDDNADTAELTGTLLRLCGANVQTAQSAREALAILTDWRPHVLLSDLGMPNQDGYELMARVRALPGERGRLPAIAITAHSDAQDRRRALAAGFTGFIVKPFDLRTLVKTLSELRARPASCDAADVQAAD